MASFTGATSKMHLMHLKFMAHKKKDLSKPKLTNISIFQLGLQNKINFHVVNILDVDNTLNKWLF